MCGRYYVDDETAGEIEKIIRRVDERLKKKRSFPSLELPARDIYPSDTALVLLPDGNGLSFQWQKWGFPGYKGSQLIINARSESALEKPAFKESIYSRRVVIPAAGFYEWNQQKEKNTFKRRGKPVLFMAGCCNIFDKEAHFIILTTKANRSVEPVHNRMPLILEEEEIEKWIFDSSKTKMILEKQPDLLERNSQYQQQSLFDLI